MSLDSNLLSGIKVLEEVESPINGKVIVFKSFAFGTYIQVEGLTQSGGVVYDVWKAGLKKVKKIKPKIKTCLILGLGGGSAASLVKKFWPEAKITGIDIDPIMVRLGERYLGMPDLKLVIGDAYDFCSQTKAKYDLVLVDTYLGYDYPGKFEKERFIRLARNRLKKKGIIVFNRLYFDKKRALAMKFGKKLEKVFSKVTPVYPEANILFICSQ